MKVTILTVACLAALTISAPMPEADPDAFVSLGAVALPAITGSALIDGLLLGKVAFLKAAILANLLLGSESADDSYGAPEPAYGPPAPTYDEPDTYGAPAAQPQQTYEPAEDVYGAPAAEPIYSAPLPSYGAPARF